MMTSFFYFLAYIAVLVAGGYAVTRRWDDASTTALMLSTDNMNGMTERYNDAIRQLEREFNKEHGVWGIGKRAIKQKYADRYEDIATQYKRERKKRIRQWKDSHPLWTKARKTWGWIFAIGLASAAVMCHIAILDSEQVSTPSTVRSSSGDTKYWNAQNIPIPYLQDSTQYVSNPDGVLAQGIVDSMNIVLKNIENEFDIQSVVVVVSHIENDDPFRMAQDVGNKYGVGRNDMGLIIVIAYEDHSINISPGISLETLLPDAECYRLEQRYVVPAMRSLQPDSAMLYLTRAIYALMKQKELPQMSSLMDDDTDVDSTLAKTLGLYMLFFIVWTMFFSHLNRKYHWVGLLGAIQLLSNPFYDNSESSGFVGGGGGFHGGGGGGFGGGSFGGGGATSRW